MSRLTAARVSGTHAHALSEDLAPEGGPAPCLGCDLRIGARSRSVGSTCAHNVTSLVDRRSWHVATCVACVL